MMIFSETVFDEVISSTAARYTSVKYCESLTKGDQLGFIAYGENANAGLTLTVAIEDSGDGIQWTQKNAVAEINAVSITNGVATYGHDAVPARPSQGYLRLRIQIGGSGLAKARVVVAAFLRDRSKSKTDCGCGCGGGQKKAAPTRRAADTLSTAPTHVVTEIRALAAAAGRVLTVEELLPKLSAKSRADVIAFGKRVSTLEDSARGELERLLRGVE
jgi:hypothetical protein